MTVRTHPSFTAASQAEITSGVSASEDGSMAYAVTQRTLWQLSLTSTANTGPDVLATLSGTGRWLLVPTVDTPVVPVAGTYAVTYDGSGFVSLETWTRAAPLSTLYRSIAYTYSSGLLDTEVEKWFDVDGLTILAQTTTTYAYSGSTLTGDTIVRNVLWLT